MAQSTVAFLRIFRSKTKGNKGKLKKYKAKKSR
jgi:hypothetical protein